MKQKHYELEWLKTKEAAEMIGVTEQTMRRWRSQNTGPPFVRLSKRTVRYSRQSLIDWMKEQ